MKKLVSVITLCTSFYTMAGNHEHELIDRPTTSCSCKDGCDCQKECKCPDCQKDSCQCSKNKKD